MKVLYLNCIEANSGWGAETFLQSALLRLGHVPYSIDYRKHRYQLYRRFLNAPDCDVLFVQKGDGVPLPLISSVQRPRFFWACDILGARPGQALQDQDPVYDRTQYRLLVSGLFDHVFVRTPNGVETAVSRGWVEREHCSILSSGFDPTLHRPEPGARKEIDVLFIGSMTPRRGRIIDEASKFCNIKVVTAYGAEMVRLFNRAKIVLNIHAGPLLDTETRVYETLGCGAFLLTERLSAENPFSEQDLVQFDSIDDLVGKIQYYLAHDEEREAIARHGHVSALNGHTYIHRAQEIVEVMSKYVTFEKDAAKPMVKQSIGLHLYGLSEPVRQLMSLGKKRARTLTAKGRTAAKSLVQ